MHVAEINSDSYEGKLVAQGVGYWRGRKVIVFDENASVLFKKKIVEFHGYAFLDISTGAWTRNYLKAVFDTEALDNFHQPIRGASMLHVTVESVFTIHM